MAKKKRTEAAPPEKPAKPPQEVPAPEVRERPEEIPDQRFSIGAYVLLNVAFDVFCLIQLFLVSFFLAEPRGLVFFFCLLMVGFLVVSAFDYLYDRAATRPAAAR